MSGGAAGLLGWSALLVTAVVLEIAGHLRHDTATTGDVLTAAMRTAPGRLLVLTVWLWLGVHFLAR